jgi:hypothetical protein
MELETVLRQAAGLAHPLAATTAGEFRIGLRTGELPAGSFLQLGGGPVAGAMPPWARGMVTRETPLASRHGLAGSILSVDALALIAVRRGAGGPPIALIGAPADPPVGGAGATRFHFGAGSVWITAPLLAAEAPADGFMGVKVASLDVVVPGPPPAGPPGGDIVIGAGDTATLSLIPAPRDPGTGFVNDGTATTATLPASIDLALAPTGISVSALGDASFATLGTTLTLSGGAASVGWDGAAHEIVLGYATAAPALFAVSGASLTGTAATIAGQYRLPVAQAAPESLGAAATGGVPTLVVAAGLAWHFGDHRVRLGPAQVLAEQGLLGLRALIDQRSFVDAFTMWIAPSPDRGGRPTSLTFTVPRGAILALVESATTEARIVFGAAMQAAIDRPLTVAGTPIALDQLLADYAVTRASDKTTLNLLGLPKPPDSSVPPPAPLPPPVEVLAIENALLRTNGAVWLTGTMTLADTQAVSGLLVAGMELRDLLPILPDPYVTNDSVFDRPALAAGLLAEIGWSSPASVGIGFTLLPPNPPPPPHDPLRARFDWGRWEALLDVSGRADQFGVYMTPGAALLGQIEGQALQLPGQELGVFTVPHISWEAVIADTVLDPGTGQPVPVPRQWFPPFSNNDGEPARLTLFTKTLVAVEPLATVAAFVDGYRAQAAEQPAVLDVALTLPFGLTAEIVAADTPSPFTPPPPRLDLLDASFAGFAAGTQLRLAAGLPQPGSPALPGFTTADGPYVQGMLDTEPGDVSTVWNEEFGHGAPVAGGPGLPGVVPASGIDLSGYGASMFSSWRDLGDGTQITQVQFDVVVGRTGYELVQEQSWILPGRIRVVDTKIFERDAAGYAVRHDSGWQPKGDGLFDYKDGSVETGGVLALRRVRNVRMTRQPDVTVGAVTYRPVAFDADVELDPERGVQPTGLPAPPAGQTLTLPCGGMVGYLRLSFSKAPPTLQDAVDLLARVAAIGAAPAAGPIAAEVAVAGTGFLFSLTGVEVQAMQPVTGQPANIAVALRGTPHLPRDGAWSVTRRTPTDTAPKPVDPHLPVPLVRRLADKAAWHITEPGELGYLAAGLEPPTKHGLLQATGTQKMLLEHPRLVDGDPLPLRTGQTPQLADVGSLLGISGLLPDVKQLAGLPNLQGLNPSVDGFQTNPLTVEQPLDLPATGLILVGPVAVELATASPAIRPVPPGGSAQSTVRLTLDATAPSGNRWSVSIDRVAFKLIVAGFGSADDPLVAVSGTLTARDGQPPGLGDIQVYYGQALSIVTSVLKGIEAVAQLLPGAGSAFSVDFSGTALRLRESFTLPTLPLGFGYLQNIGLDMGFDVDLLSRKLHFAVGVGSDQDPFDWLVSPLAGNGLISLGAEDQLGVRMEAGIGAGLGIDLAIASGSASVTLAVKIDTTQNPFILMVILTGSASVDVLDGLASASLTLSAGIGVSPPVFPPPPPVPPSTTQFLDFVKHTQITLEAMVAVGIHLSVCWVVHVDWTGFWQFKETVTGAALTDLLP